jgi:hypothetical protein
MPAAARLMTAHQLGTSLRIRGKVASASAPLGLTVHATLPDGSAGELRQGKRASSRLLTASAGRHLGRGFALSSGPWWLHAVAVAEKPSTVIVIGVIVVCTFITKTIQVIYAQRAKIIGAKAKRDVEKLRAQRETSIAEVRAVVHSLLLLSGNAAMVRAEVLNPDLPEGRRLSDDHILKALLSDEAIGDSGSHPGNGPTGVVLPMDQGDGVALPPTEELEKNHSRAARLLPLIPEREGNDVPSPVARHR